MSESKKGIRIQYIDIIKSLAISMVVLIHINFANAVVKPWATAFVMPTFFFASGLLLKTETGTLKTELAFCWKKFQGIMIPYFIWTLIYHLVWVLFNRSLGGVSALLNILYGSHQSLGNAHTLTSIWCLPVLFLAMVLFSVCRLLFKDKLNLPVKLILVVVFLAMGAVIPKLSNGYPWGVNLVPTAFGFLMLGNALFPVLERVRQRLNSKGGLAILISGTVVCFAVTFLYLLNIPECGYIHVAIAAYGNYLLFLVVAFDGIAYILFLSLLLDRMLSKKQTAISRFFNFLGKSTLCILFTHKLFTHYVFKTLFRFVHVPNVVALIVTWIGTIAGCSLAALFIQRFLPFLLGHFPVRKTKQQNTDKNN